jgi:hypothetical protein
MGIYSPERWVFGLEYNQTKAQYTDSFHSVAQGTILVVFRWAGDVSKGKGAK